MTTSVDDEVIVPHKYDDFRYSNGSGYAYLEVPVAFLDEALPLDANWATTNEDEETLVVKTLGEYVLYSRLSKDGTKAIIRLAGSKGTTRPSAVTYDDLQDWETWLDTKSYPIDNWLTISERNALLESEAYDG